MPLRAQSRHHPWTAADIRMLRQLAGRRGAEVIVRILKRTPAAVRSKASAKRIPLAMKSGRPVRVTRRRGQLSNAGQRDHIVADPGGKFWLSVKREGAIYQAIDRESDRGVAILLASLVEERLKSALLARLKHLPKGHAGSIKDTFAVCIDKAAKLRILGPEAHANLSLIRRVRNQFAHVLTGSSPAPLSFEDPEITAMCRQFRLPNDGRARTSRQCYVAACAMHALDLQFFSNGNQHFDTGGYFQLA
jgi:hypothetical protein